MFEAYPSKFYYHGVMFSSFRNLIKSKPSSLFFYGVTLHESTQGTKSSKFFFIDEKIGTKNDSNDAMEIYEKFLRFELGDDAIQVFINKYS